MTAGQGDMTGPSICPDWCAHKDAGLGYHRHRGYQAHCPLNTRTALVGQGDECVVILATGQVMTADDAERLAVALIRAADRSRRTDT